MIELYYWPTPNGQKIALFVEEAGVEYELKTVDITKGEQFAPDYLAISPNNRMPAIVDRDPSDGGKPISVFESGAILLYLADKTGQFIPKDLRGRIVATEWLFWQVGGLGPMIGQSHHFEEYAPTKIEYAIERYARENQRLLGVLERHLTDRDFICGEDYTIADMASYPWVASYASKNSIDAFSAVKRWHEAIKARPATERVYARGEEISPSGRPLSDEARRHLFGHGKAA